MSVTDPVEDTLSGFEFAELTGGVSANVIDASAFSYGVQLDGGSQIYLTDLFAGGLGTTDEAFRNLNGVEDTTDLNVLNNGAGVRSATGTDFNITLSDGTTVVSVDISSAATLADVLSAIETASRAILPIHQAHA